jgi:hypothetical protein
VNTTMRGNGGIKQGYMTLYRNHHRLAIAFPESGALNDIGEEEGDSATG